MPANPDFFKELRGELLAPRNAPKFLALRYAEEDQREKWAEQKRFFAAFKEVPFELKGKAYLQRRHKLIQKLEFSKAAEDRWESFGFRWMLEWKEWFLQYLPFFQVAKWPYKLVMTKDELAEADQKISQLLEKQKGSSEPEFPVPKNLLPFKHEYQDISLHLGGFWVIEQVGEWGCSEGIRVGLHNGNRFYTEDLRDFFGGLYIRMWEDDHVKPILPKTYEALIASLDQELSVWVDLSALAEPKKEDAGESKKQKKPLTPTANNATAETSEKKSKTLDPPPPEPTVLNIQKIAETYTGWELLENYGDLPEPYYWGFEPEVVKGFWRDLCEHKFARIDNFEAFEKYHIKQEHKGGAKLCQRVLWLKAQNLLVPLQEQLIKLKIWPDRNANAFMEKMFLVIDRNRTKVHEINKFSQKKDGPSKNATENTLIIQLVNDHFKFEKEGGTISPP